MIKQKLQKHGYCIIKNILSPEEIETADGYFRTWQRSIPNLDEFHYKCDPHGIFKFHEIGHQKHAWYVRTT